MALRLIEIIAKADAGAHIVKLLEEHEVLAHWSRPLFEGGREVQVLVDARHTEAIIDQLQTYYAHAHDFRVVVQQVEATIPRPEAAEESAPEEGAQEKKAKARDRISREELYADVEEGARTGITFLVTVTLSTLVAAIGLIRSDTAVIIAAMVIAPLLGPNMALALATTLGDEKLARRALKSNGIGLAVAIGIAAAIGIVLLIMGTRPEDSEGVLSRTHVNAGDVLLALAAGTAGALAYTRNAAGSLVGVMVAVALLPPLVCAVMLMVSKSYALAGNALLLFGTNVICVNLAGVTTFLASGIRPRTWWDADRARKATRRAITAWLLLLSVLVTILAVS